MDNYKKLNNIFGLIAFLAAFTVYFLTAEPTASMWDCGEFIAASYGLQVVHPPGAPLFLLIGRFFSLFAGDNLQHVAFMVNMVSVVTSALCVMFTFWITTYFARRLVQKNVENPGTGHAIAIMGAGLVAALTLTFSDTFWFSAVEAEVYAASSFFTALTFWAILKWEENADKPHSDRWLVFIGYVIGLAVGVHLLNLLVIPAVVFVYYFRRYPHKVSRKGIVLTALLSGAILVFVQLGIIPGIPTLAAKFDVFFVNGMSMPFGSGAIFFLALLIAATVFGVIYSRKKGKVMLNTFLLCFSFILIGYSSYVMVVIRSRANPPIDMNNPDDPTNLAYYLNREQYEDRPLLYGPYFYARHINYKETTNKYLRGEEEYDVVGKNFKLIYADKDQTFFPRMSAARDELHARGYREWSGLSEKAKPKMKHNMSFFINYQLGWMYWRYFMWNFSGRQNEEQGYIGPVNGNWISGIDFIDEARLGPQDNIPESIEKNKARNKYYMLPFILGIIGLVYHIRKAGRDSAILGILFLITGVVLIVYLNPPPYEPRERDYVFVGSFQVFCTWVGFSVLALAQWLSKRINMKVAAGAASVVALLAAPALMASQNWDDHDRSNRYMTIDFAKDYLASCPKNAILFTNGDNDTYPLWYAQNVEKIRTDVRVINYQLISAGDYAEGLTRQMYESAPIKLSFQPKQFRAGTRDYVSYKSGNPKYNPDTYYELKDIMKFVASENDADKAFDQKGKPLSYYPAKKFKLTIDENKWIQNGWMKPADTTGRLKEILFEMPGNETYRHGMLLLDIIGNNINERPICFTATTGSEVYYNLSDYFETRGLVYRLVPYKTPPEGYNAYGRIDSDDLYKLLVKTYTYGGMENEEMFVDDKAKMVPSNARNYYSRLAQKLVEEGKKDKAIEVLDHSQKAMPDHNMPFGYEMMSYVEVYYRAGATQKGDALLDRLAKEAGDRLRYFSRLNQKDGMVKQETQNGQAVLNNLAQIAKQNGREEKAKQVEAMMGAGK